MPIQGAWLGTWQGAWLGITAPPVEPEIPSGPFVLYPLYGIGQVYPVATVVIVYTNTDEEYPLTISQAYPITANDSYPLLTASHIYPIVSPAPTYSLTNAKPLYPLAGKELAAYPLQ
jgi:hypothetical protein